MRHFGRRRIFKPLIFYNRRPLRRKTSDACMCMSAPEMGNGGRLRDASKQADTPCYDALLALTQHRPKAPR